MDLSDKVNQLTDLLADLIPTVDRLGKTQEKTVMEISEMRLSNMKLAEAIEKLVVKIDKLSNFEQRLERLEKIVLK
jgi:hypothetical protein